MVNDKNIRHYRGLFRQTGIPPCVVSVADLRRLYNDLSEKAVDALERHLLSVKRPETTSEENWETLKQNVRELGGLTAIVIGANGEQNVDQSPTPLDAEQLPDRITSVTFDSYYSLQNNNITPLNRFKLHVDLSEPPGFGAYNPWDIPTPNGSLLEVTGSDSTWVTGVYESVLGFFRSRRRRRGWLHSPVTFNCLNWMLGLPAALWIVYRVDVHALEFFEGMHAALRGSIYVYIVLLVLLAFRILIAAFRWTFPVVEIEGGRSSATRAVLNFVMGTLLLALAYDVLKTLFWPS